MLVTFISSALIVGILGVLFGIASVYGRGISLDEHGAEAGGKSGLDNAGCASCGAGGCGFAAAEEGNKTADDTEDGFRKQVRME